MKKRNGLRWRQGFIAVLLLVVVTTAGGCQKEAVDPPSKEDGILVGFSMATLKEDRWLRDRDIFFAKAKQENISVIVTNANNDADLQYKQVAEMVAQGIDVLVIAPQDGDSAVGCVELAKRAGIPVVSYDRLVRNANVDVYVSFDNLKVGQLQSKALTEAVPEGGYLILNGSPDDNNSQMFNKGYMTHLREPVDAGRIEIVAETWVSGWLRETAFEFVSDQLRRNGDKIKAIIAANDSLAWAAIDALSEARLTEQVKVVGHDADLAACQRIVVGTQMLTVYKPIKNLVEATVHICLALAEGEPIQYEQTINDGSYDVPYVMIDVIAVTKDNIDDTVIKDNFHLKEDVYRNAAK